MIRINLLGTPKSKNKRSAASTVAAMDMGDVGSPAMKVAVAAALLVVFNLGYWYKLDREKQSIATKRSEEHTSELQSRFDLVCRLLPEKKNHAPTQVPHRWRRRPR